MLYLWLYPLHTEFAIFNVFRYLSFRMIYAAITAFPHRVCFGSTYDQQASRARSWAKSSR